MIELVTTMHQLPSTERLAAGLTAIFRERGLTRGDVAIIERRCNILTSTFPSEIVTCRLDHRRVVQVLCKFENGYSAGTHGHRGGVVYEARTYRDILRPLDFSTPEYFGAYQDEEGEFWLAIEYLNDYVRLTKVDGDDAMAAAAHWIGRFHAAHPPSDNGDWPPWINRHDSAYYLGWAERTSQVADHFTIEAPWLATLCECYAAQVDLLVQQPQTLIHGEYYPKNILVQNGVIRPVDWESVAVAAGEIDLASLTDQWPASTVQRCKQAYLAARWPDGAPPDFESALVMARCYFEFRWLGRRPEHLTLEEIHRRLAQLHALGIEAGWIA